MRHSRHTTAVHLLSAGVDVTVIRSWLGHAHLDTTNHYAQASLETKRKALEQIDSVYFVPLQRPTSIEFLTFDKNQVRPIANFQKPIEGPGCSGALSVYPDGEWTLA